MAETSTAASETTRSYPETTATPPATAEESAETTNAETEPAPEIDISVLYGAGKLIGGSATTVITEKEITEEEGHSVSFPYSVNSTEITENGNFICVIRANNSDYVYAVFKTAEGHGLS